MWLLPNLLASKNLKQILIKAPEKGLQLPSLSLISVVDVLVADRAQSMKNSSPSLSQPSCLLLSELLLATPGLTSDKFTHAQ